MERAMNNSIIKQCTVCGAQLTLEQFEYDPEIVPIGMMFIDDDITEAYYLFQHEKPGCGTCLVLPVEQFRPAIIEQIPEQIMAFASCCEQHCTRVSELANCKAACLFAPYRRHLIALVERKGRAQVPDRLVLTQ